MAVKPFILLYSLINDYRINGQTYKFWQRWYCTWNKEIECGSETINSAIFIPYARIKSMDKHIEHTLGEKRYFSLLQSWCSTWDKQIKCGNTIHLEISIDGDDRIIGERVDTFCRAFCTPNFCVEIKESSRTRIAMSTSSWVTCCLRCILACASDIRIIDSICLTAIGTPCPC